MSGLSAENLKKVFENETDSLRAENLKLREALRFMVEGTRWKSADNDNMEFDGRVTCYQLQKARVALMETPQ
jgi:hypothetical protein